MNAYFTIGQVAGRTGLPPKTVRFWSDAGLVPETGRSHGGYRLYDAEAVARLELIRTLRDLGFGLAAIRSVLDGAATPLDVVRRHVAELDGQIAALSRRRAVLRAVVRASVDADSTKELMLMNELATMSDEQRERVIDEFWDATFGGLDVNPGLVAKMRSVRPRLGDDPTPEQVEAWIELADLVRDEGFRARVRSMAEGHHERRRAGEELGPASAADQQSMGEVMQVVQQAVADGIDPRSPQAQPIVERVAGALLGDRAGDPEARRELLAQWEQATDPRVDRLWFLLAVINGWPATDNSAANAWLIEALSG